MVSSLSRSSGVSTEGFGVSPIPEPENASDSTDCDSGLVATDKKDAEEEELEGEDDVDSILDEFWDEEKEDEGEEESDGIIRNRLEWFLEPGDCVQKMCKCSVVEGMDTQKSVLVVSAQNVYVVTNFTLDAKNAVVDVSDEARDKDRLSDYEAHATLKWARTSLRRVVKRRYTLRWVALEVFTARGESALLVFEPADFEGAYRLLKRVAGAHKGGAGAPPSFSASRMQSDAHVHGELDVTGSGAGSSGVSNNGSAFRRVLLSERSLNEVTQLWVNGTVSNFQYLMYLNTAAGRSYNDLTQYPVFPWVLRDYASAALDLDDPAVYRDLSKPIGALDPARAAQFREHYAQCVGVTEPYHYSHHYSSAAVVLGYLLRLEPFARAFLALHGGRWDWPDRLFHDVRETWAMISAGAFPQVMELVPEFFYLPQFLRNANRFALGRTDTGTDVSEVALPPWAHGSARAFVARHLQALESPHVSAHLHEWIDLVFGCKQQGPAAVAALNVFNPVSYEGAVDVDAIADPVERASTIATIREFGQTPRQLWDARHPHPRRAPAACAVPPPPPWTTPGAPVRPAVIAKVGTRPVAAVHVAPDDRVFAVCAGRALLAPAQPLRQAGFACADGSLRLWLGDRLLATCVPAPGFRVTAVAPADDAGSTLVAGSEDSLVRIYSIRAAGDARSSDSSESGDSSSSNTSTASQKGHSPSGNESSNSSNSGNSVFVLEATLAGHNAAVTCVVVSREYGIVVSGGADGRCIVWDLAEAAFVCELLVADPAANAHPEPVVCIDVHSVTGEIAACTGSRVTLWSVNGVLEAAATVEGRPVRTNAVCCCAFSSDWVPGRGRALLTGHGNGTVTVWDLEPVPFEPAPATLAAARVLSAGEGAAAITALAVPAHQDRSRFYAGNALGVVTQWSVPKKK